MFDNVAFSGRRGAGGVVLGQGILIGGFLGGPGQYSETSVTVIIGGTRRSRRIPPIMRARARRGHR